jgi:hypothetical protein
MDTSSLSLLIAVVSAVTAILAAGFAYWSARTSQRALRLAERQESRRLPALVLYLADGYLRRNADAGHRVYAFLISISNQSDSDDAIARLDLRISYRTSGNFRAAVDVPSSPGPAGGTRSDAYAKLQTPVRVDSHQTVTGWAQFEVASALLEECTVDGYEVLVTGTHGERATIETAIVRELVDEAEAKVG